MATVSVRRTRGEGYEDIKRTVDQVLADLGGLGDIIKPGDRVMIKPNLVACPTERLSGGVTRWEVCLAVYEAVEAAGGRAYIAESSAAGADTEQVIQKCGYQGLRDRGIPVIDLKQKENARCVMEVPGGVVFEKINTWELVRDTDVFITVPVMKTHDQTEITLGLKNMKGLLSDAQKKAFHKEGLVEGVADWCSVLKPALEIVDGTYGQQGLGPIFGETKRMDLICGSKDLVACEAVVGKIMGYEPEEVMITKAAHERGLGEMDLGKIQVLGCAIEEVASRFKRSCEITIEGVPASFSLIFHRDACTGCHNTVLSALMDMKARGLFAYLEHMNVCVGPCTEADLPDGASAENTVCVGVCSRGLAERLGLRWVNGCPPCNADVAQGILGDRKDYGARYA
ncbi:MAG: DUF362 domain-containing protein [Oscillibacter sp.]|nr:DUF362 domain-containing protein [Oscillibacter sp.]